MEELRGAIRNSTDHMIQGPSKEHEHTKVEFCGIVIPKKWKEIPKVLPFSQHEKARFNIRKLKNWLNERS